MSVRAEPTATSEAERLAGLIAGRSDANRRFFAGEAERLARLCHRMAERFARGGRLLAVGLSPQARSDVRHVTVEFVHPVIVGKRALPALGLSREGGGLLRQLELLAAPTDMVIGFGCHEEGGDEVRAAIEQARGLGCLTIAFERAGAEWELEPPAEDPFVHQELVETAYHVLWELVHVFFEHRGLLGEGPPTPRDSGAAGFLYPFLSRQEANLEAIVDDVRSSALAKAEEVGELRERTLREGAEPLLGAARELRRSFQRGGKLLALGNGGSATDAIDLVADFRDPPAPRNGAGGWTPLPAIDLTEDTAVLTAIANDIGVKAIFARQLIAHARLGDALVALSTSGDSENVIEALAEARRRGLVTVAMVGYEGGRIAGQALADHTVVVRSEHIPRIQEAQASAYHALRELVEHRPAEAAS